MSNRLSTSQLFFLLCVAMIMAWMSWKIFDLERGSLRDKGTHLLEPLGS